MFHITVEQYYYNCEQIEDDQFFIYCYNMLDLKYINRIETAIENFLQDKLLLKMLQKEKEMLQKDNSTNYSEDETLMLYKMDTLLINAIHNLKMNCEVEKEVNKLKIAVENGDLTREKIIKIIQDGDINNLGIFLGGKLKKRKTKKRKTKKRKNYKIYGKRRTKKQRGGTDNATVATVDPTDVCSICYEVYTSDEEIYFYHDNHRFHRVCIAKWLAKGRENCPLCRTNGPMVLDEQAGAHEIIVNHVDGNVVGNVDGNVVGNVVGNIAFFAGSALTYQVVKFLGIAEIFGGGVATTIAIAAAITIGISRKRHL